jgi:hypothetical protein
MRLAGRPLPVVNLAYLQWQTTDARFVPKEQRRVILRVDK